MSRVKRIKTYYKAIKGENLPDYKILGWESREAQNERFKILLSHVEMHKKMILDVGCGLGNLLEYITSKGIRVDYIGVDILKEMIDRVEQKGLNGVFLHGDIFKEDFFQPKSFDVVYSSGIFNIDLGNNKLFLQDAVKRFYELSREYIVFNLLHHKSPGKEPPYFYFNPGEVAEIVKDACGNDIEIKIIEQYLKNDFTMILRKRRHTNPATLPV